MDHSKQEYSEETDEELQAWQETIEILQDAELMEAIRQALEAAQNGDTVPLEEAKRMLGLA